MQHPRSATRFLCRTEANACTSCRKLVSPAAVESLNRLQATSWPSRRVPLYTFPKPPWPMIISVSKLRVAARSSSMLYHVNPPPCSPMDPYSIPFVRRTNSLLLRRARRRRAQTNPTPARMEHRKIAAAPITRYSHHGLGFFAPLMEMMSHRQTSVVASAGPAVTTSAAV